MTKAILPTPQKVKSEETRQRLYQAVRSLMRDYGYEYLTIQNICKLAGVTTGAFYHHFHSKDDILCLFLNKRYDEYIASLEMELPENPLERLTETCVLYAAHGEVYGLNFLTNYYSTKNKTLVTHNMTPETMHVSSNYTARYECLVQARDQGLIASDLDLLALNEDICSMTKGVIFDWCLSDGCFSLTEKIRQMVNHYMLPYLLNP